MKMDKYKMFGEVQDKIGDIQKLADDLTIADLDDIITMLKALENVWVRMSKGE